MKKLILLLIIATAFASGIKAQTITSGSGSSYYISHAQPNGTGKSVYVNVLAGPGYHEESRIESPQEVRFSPDPDTINYIAIYRDTTKDLNGQVIYPVIMTQKIAGFKTQGTLGTFLNEKVDSTNLFAVYDVRTKKPLKTSFSVEDIVVEKVVAERQRNRKWRVQ